MWKRIYNLFLYFATLAQKAEKQEAAISQIARPTCGVSHLRVFGKSAP